MEKLLTTLDAVERLLIALLAAAALLLACAAMVGRYVLPGLSLDWSFELTIFTTIWATFLAGARLAGQGGHVRVDTLLTFLPESLRFWLVIVACVLGIAVGLFLLWSGCIVVEEAYRWDERTTSSLRLPLWIYYLCLPAGACLIVFHLVARTWRLLSGTERDELSQHDH